MGSGGSHRELKAKPRVLARRVHVPCGRDDGFYSIFVVYACFAVWKKRMAVFAPSPSVSLKPKFVLGNDDEGCFLETRTDLTCIFFYISVIFSYRKPAEINVRVSRYLCTSHKKYIVHGTKL
jgi:hypothetical protein